VFCPRKCDVDPIDALQEAYRGLAFFKRARISDQGDNDDFCFLTLEGVHCADANVSRDLDLGESYLVITC
jgi:hypothetical protein